MADSTLIALEQRGVRTVRITYPDLHGISRGKDYPLSHVAHLTGEGGAFCEAIMTVDLRHNVVAGPEHGFQDILARPDLDTLVPVPWEQDTAWCLADLVAHGRLAVRRRSARRRCAGRWPRYAELGLTPIVGPELEFYLCLPDPDATVGYRRYVDNPSHVYTVGHIADPRGVLTHDAARVRRHGPRRDRGQPRVRPQPVRDQPQARPGARRRRPRVPVQGASSRTWPRARACWRRSSASPGTTTRARASTCTSRSATARAETP